MTPSEIRQAIKVVGNQITVRGRVKLEAELAHYTTLTQEVEYWADEKGLDLDTNQLDELADAVIARWDELTDEEIEEIAEDLGLTKKDDVA